ncbi:lamin tail domain-containing protein [Candidatus Pacearchaeota archaeon]|nr:lamin tail domain-containing protein [Candidatus Pacearchaeota archaeon]
MSRKKLISFLVFLVFLLIAFNYNFLDKKLTGFVVDSETAVVQRIVDGDTLELADGRHVRLLGINTPEKGEIYSSEAKNFTTEKLLNKVDDEFFNVQLVENGLANFYFPSGKDSYYKQFKSSWEKCISENKYLCEKSHDSACIKLKILNVAEQTATFENICSYSINLKNWDLKDEGRKHFVFPEFDVRPNQNFLVIVGNGRNNENEIFWDRKDYVWTKSGDTLFLRDENNKLVSWFSY